jgi:hypothetical protein
MPADTLTLREINRATLARQMLLTRERITALKAVERLVAMQAQWPRPPFVGLWTRLEKFRRDDLTTLLEKRQVVRATFVRGTLHLATAKDFIALRPAIQPMLHAAMHAILKERAAALNMDRLINHARALLAREPRTFEELRDEFLRKDPKADERAMGYAVRMMLPLVQVPVGNKSPWAFPSQARFALADEWLGRRVPLETSSPPDQLVLRYLAAYGPASLANIQAWTGLAKLGDTIEALRPRLKTFTGGGQRELFDLPDAPRPDEDVTAPVRFLPEYDSVIATRADERFVSRPHRSRVFLSALRIAATVLVDGFAAATWKLERTKHTAAILIEPFSPFAAKVRKEVTAEAEALVRFAEPDAREFDVRFN